MQDNVKRLIYSQGDISACLLQDMKTNNKKADFLICLNQSSGFVLR